MNQQQTNTRRTTMETTVKTLKAVIVPLAPATLASMIADLTNDSKPNLLTQYALAMATHALIGLVGIGEAIDMLGEADADAENPALAAKIDAVIAANEAAAVIAADERTEKAIADLEHERGIMREIAAELDRIKAERDAMETAAANNRA